MWKYQCLVTWIYIFPDEQPTATRLASYRSSLCVAGGLRCRWERQHLIWGPAPRCGQTCAATQCWVHRPGLGGTPCSGYASVNKHVRLAFTWQKQQMSSVCGERCQTQVIALFTFAKNQMEYCTMFSFVCVKTRNICNLLMHLEWGRRWKASYWDQFPPTFQGQQVSAWYIIPYKLPNYWLSSTNVHILLGIAFLSGLFPCHFRLFKTFSALRSLKVHIQL